MIAFVFLSFSGAFIGKRPYFLYYEGRFYFPKFSGMIKGEEFGLNYSHEVNYKELKDNIERKEETALMIFPFLYYDEDEIDLKENDFPPIPPVLKKRHFLGTDMVGRDLLVRVILGLRNAFFFALVLTLSNFIFGVLIGGLMGHFGGIFDLFMQGVIEVFSHISFIYLLIIIGAIFSPSLMGILVLAGALSWMSIAIYTRTLVYKEKEKNYILNLKVLGASHFRIFFRHIIPNICPVMVTFIPFKISAGMNLLVALDFLGMGTRPPTASLGELLREGVQNYHYPWLIFFPALFFALFLILIHIWGEHLREKIDPQKNHLYK